MQRRSFGGAWSFASPQRALLCAASHPHARPPPSAAAYEALKDLKEALRDYKAVLERDPSLADAAVGVRRCESALGLPSSLPPAGKGRAGGARAPARPAISEEDARSLAELQTRVRDVGKSKMRASEQRRAADQEKRRAELTLEQVTALPETKRLYTALGRAYVLAPRATVTAGLRDESTKADKRSRVCTLTLEHLVKQEEEAVAAGKEAVAAAQRGAQRT